MISQANRTKSAPLTKEAVRKGDGRGKVSVLVPKGAPNHLLEKYKKNIAKKDEYLEYAVRGAKAQSLAEIAQVIKWLSTTDTKSAFEMLAKDFKIAYGDGKNGLIYARTYLKKFGIKDVKIAQTKKFDNGQTVDIIQIWSATPVNPDA